MPSTAPGHLYRFGIAKQADEATVATVAEYEVPMFEGDLNPSQNRVRHEVADGNPYRPGGFIAGAEAGGRVVVPSFPASAPRFIKGHLGRDVVTGAGDPRTHTMDLLANPDWHTAWIARPKIDGTFQWDRFESGRIAGAQIMWLTGQQTRLGVDMIFKNVKVDVTAPTVTVDNQLDNTESYHQWAGSVVKIDVDATPASTVVTNVRRIDVNMQYANAAMIQTGAVSPEFLHLGLWSLTVTIEGVLQDYSFYKAAYFGSKTAANVGLSSTILTGSLDLTIPVGPVADANRTMQIKLPAIEYLMTAPAVDVSGAEVPFTVAAEVNRPATGSPVEVLVKNAVATAY